ncbi:MAG: WYL domain-containing protein [Ilumatobacteraceae bacterium]
MDRLERVTNLLALLLETRRPLTLEQIVDELSGQYPSSPTARRAAFERDKKLLREEGVPIEQEVLGGDRAGQTAYRIDRRRFELGDLGLTDEERHALQVAVAALHLGADWGDEALWKLERADDPPLGGLIGIAASLPAHTALPALFQAVVERRGAGFTYHDRARMLHPYGLLSRDGFWYVIGHDLDSDALRTYRVDRIGAGEIRLGEPGAFTRPDDFRPSAAFPADPKLLGEADGDGDDGSRFATVLVDAARARTVIAGLGSAAVVERLEDGSAVVSVPCTNRGAFRSWVLGLGEHAEVLEPPAIRDHVVAWLVSMAEEPAR